jgi:hypothetical protein
MPILAILNNIKEEDGDQKYRVKGDSVFTGYQLVLRM